VEPLNGVSKGGEHPLCEILISGGVQYPAREVVSFISSSPNGDHLKHLK